MKRPVRLAVTLTYEERRIWVEVKGDTQDNAMADKVIVDLIKSGWKVKEFEKIVNVNEVAAFIKSKKELGATWEELIVEFNVKPTNMTVPLDKLRLGHSYGDGPYGDDFSDGDKIIIKPRGMSVTYIASEFVEKVQKLEKEEKIAIAASGNKTVSFTREEPEGQQAAVPEMTKAEGKRQRKSIVDKATKDSLLGESFKKEFLTSLTEMENQYLQTLDSFRTKLMITEIRKKT